MAVLAFQGELSAESADELLDRVRSHYLSKANLEVTGYTRELSVSEAQDADSGRRNFRVVGAEYHRVVLTRRLPDDWRIVVQREDVARGEVRSSQTIVLGKTGETEASVLLLNPSTKGTFRLSIPAAIFKQEAGTRIGYVGMFDPVFRLLFQDRENWATFHGRASNLKIEGTEVVDGVRLTRIASNWPSHAVTRLWIDAESLLLVRVLEAPGEEADRHIRMGMPVSLKETIYRHDLTKGNAAADFDLDAGWTLAGPNIAAAADFMPSTQLFAAYTSGGAIVAEAPVAKTPKAPKTPETPKPPPSDTPAQPPGDLFASGGAAGSPSPAAPAAPAGAPASTPAAPPVESQSLTPEQMGAIVLIEGEEGVGTGFIAKIRGVDFVVTNQHVIGGNEKLRITTVKGVSIPVGGIFGAVGRDIAILRIEGENKVPPLTLAADPLKTAKLGDKVVVVGNRRGGGVATQLSGAVRGIGPDRLEVDAPFQPGNSGSPIVHLATGEVLGVASYSQTRKLDELDGPAATATDAKKDEPAKEEQRWFGFRADEVGKWETIDLAKWRVQAKRVADFAADTEAIYYAMRGKFTEASRSPRIKPAIDRLNERAARGASQLVVTQEVGEFFRSLRALSQAGVKELKTGEYYDFFRTNDYWETSITQQLRVRADINERLGKASETSVEILSQLRR